MRYAAFIVLVASIAVCVGCTATRVVTTQATHVKHGDTTTTIVTKTVERYEATRKGVDL